MATDVTSRVFVAGRNNVLIRVGTTFIQANATKAQALEWDDRIIRCSKCDKPATQIDLLTPPALTLCGDHAL